MKKLLMIISLIVVFSALLTTVAFAQDNKVTVTFDSNGGSAVAPVEVTKGEKLTPPKAPEKDYFDFAGWYVVNGDKEEEWSFIGYTVTEDITLVAKWVENGEMPPMEFKINGGNFLTSLGYMGKGMVGIFVVTLVIIGVVATLNWHGRSLEKRNQNKE